MAWARKNAGFSLEDAARLAMVKDTKKLSAAERLISWESGEDAPTQNQLADIAKAYCRPVLTFYLANPPIPDSDVVDFRTFADHDVKLSPQLRALVSKMKSRQQEVLEILEDDEDSPTRLSFVGRFPGARNVGAVVKDIESVLQLPIEKRQQLVGKDALLRLIRNSAEAAGIFVLAQGDLGSSRSDIMPDEFRGFVLADDLAPFIVLNDNDHRHAQLFTLVHELAHLWIGDSGVSNFNPFDTGAQANDEHFCNQVAAEFLMPRDYISRSWEAHSFMGLESAVAKVASGFGVSHAAAARRLVELNLIPNDDWWALYSGYRKEWDRIRQEQKENGKNAPVYFPMKKSQLGSRLIRTVLGAVEAGAITYTRAARILDASPQNFAKLKA